jgi:translation initiation factor 5A
MTNEGATKDDVKVPEGDLGDKIRADFDDGKEVFVSITKAMNEEACLAHRVA